MDPDDAAAATREAGGIPDEQFVGDAKAAIKALRALPTSNGKVGVIGYCSGGRHSFLTAVSLPVDAAVDCYGAFVDRHPPEGFPLKVTPLGRPDAGAALPAARPVRQRGQVPQPRAGRRAGAGARGGRQDVRVPPLRRRRPRLLRGRPSGLPARGGRRRLAAHLRVVRHAPGGGLTMCSYLTVATEVAGSAKGAAGMVFGHVGQRLLRPSLPRALRPHAEHRLRRPVPWAGRPGRRRAQRRVGPPLGREHPGSARRRRGRRLVRGPREAATS